MPTIPPAEAAATRTAFVPSAPAFLSSHGLMPRAPFRDRAPFDFVIRHHIHQPAIDADTAVAIAKAFTSFAIYTL